MVYVSRVQELTWINTLRAEKRRNWLRKQRATSMSAHDHSSGDRIPRENFFTSPAGLVLIGFLAIGGVYLWMEHRAHLLGALVFLPLLLCPLMHLFMHHGHGDHSDHDSSKGTSR